MKVHKVNSLSKVDPTKYFEGDFFLTKKSIGFLHNGKIEVMVKQSEVKKLIADLVRKEVKKDES